MKAKVSAPIPFSAANRMVSRRRARHPEGRVRLLHGFGDDVAWRHLHEAAVDAGERRFGHAAERDLQAFEPGLTLRRRIDQETAQLGFRAGLPGTELDPSTRQQVERGHPLGRAGGVVVAGRGLNDPVPEPDVLRPLAARAEEHLWCRGVAVLLQEVMLDLPHHVEPEAIGQLDLLQGVLQDAELGVLLPRTRKLVLVEDSELHAAPSDWNSARMSGPFARSRAPVLHLGQGRPPALLAYRAKAVGEQRIPDSPDHVGARVLAPPFAPPGAVAHLGERRAQVADMRRLVGPDVGHEPGCLPVPRYQFGVGHPFLRPGERVERGDLNEEDTDHQRDHHFELVGNVVGEHAGRLGARAARAEPHPSQHRLDVELVARPFERDVACSEPHVLVARFLVPAGLVATVRLEETPAEVIDRGPANVLDEMTLQILGLQQADVGAESLDRADPGQRRHEGLGHSGADQEAGLLDVGERALPPFERDLDELAAEQRTVLLAPRADRRQPKLRPG